jgi:hypothetical protein
MHKKTARAGRNSALMAPDKTEIAQETAERPVPIFSSGNCAKSWFHVGFRINETGASSQPQVPASSGQAVP